MEHDYKTTFETSDGVIFAEESYHGTFDYVLDCARAYCVEGETFKVYQDGVTGLVWLETKGAA